MVLPVDLDVAVEAELVDGDWPRHRLLVDAAPVRPPVGQWQQVGAGDADRLDPPRGAEAAIVAPPRAGHFLEAVDSLVESAATKASWGTSTRPTIFIRFLPSFCFSSSFRLRVMSPP